MFQLERVLFWKHCACFILRFPVIALVEKPAPFLKRMNYTHRDVSGVSILDTFKSASQWIT
jgi:hypothetical protein